MPAWRASPEIKADNSEPWKSSACAFPKKMFLVFWGAIRDVVIFDDRTKYT